MSEYDNHRFAHESLTNATVDWPLPSREVYDPLDQLDIDFSHSGIRRLDDTYLPVESIAGLALASEDKTPRATMSFKGYRIAPEALAPQDSKQRGLLFCTNGGPISAATGWIGMELYTPAYHEPEGSGAHPIFSHQRPIDLVDIVYADPPGTGYGRTLDETPENYFFGVERDAELMTEFLKSYRERYANQGSIFLLGCSYSGFRTVAMANKLLDEGLPFGGVISVSGSCDYKLVTAAENQLQAGLSTALYLPVYAATADYHGKGITDSSQSYAYDEASHFAWGPYMDAIRSGRNLSPGEQRKMSALTGMSQRLLAASDFTTNPKQFSTELLADEGRIISHVDTRSVYPKDTQAHIDPLLDDESGRRQQELDREFWMIDPDTIPGGYRFNSAVYQQWPFAGEWRDRNLYAGYTRIMQRCDAPIIELNGMYDLLVSPTQRKLFWEALTPGTGWQVEEHVTDDCFMLPKPQSRTIHRHLLPTGHQPALTFLDSTDVSGLVHEVLQNSIGGESVHVARRADHIVRLLQKRYQNELEGGGYVIQD